MCPLLLAAALLRFLSVALPGAAQTLHMVQTTGWFDADYVMKLWWRFGPRLRAAERAGPVVAHLLRRRALRHGAPCEKK